MNFMLGRIIKKKDGKLYFDEGKIIVRIAEEMYKKLNPYTGKEIMGLRSERYIR